MVPLCRGSSLQPPQSRDFKNTFAQQHPQVFFLVFFFGFAAGFAAGFGAEAVAGVGAGAGAGMYVEACGYASIDGAVGRYVEGAE